MVFKYLFAGLSITIFSSASAAPGERGFFAWPRAEGFGGGREVAFRWQSGLIPLDPRVEVFLNADHAPAATFVVPPAAAGVWRVVSALNSVVSPELRAK
ncbi:MAG: hypothetical protein ACOVS5_05170 [Oligoflexus sp.]